MCPISARRTEAGSTVAVIVIPWRRPVVAVTRPAIAPLAPIAGKPAVHVADVANATIHITQRSSAPASICPAAIGYQRISAGCHMCASAQIRSGGSTLRVRVYRGGCKRQHHGRSCNETTFACKPELAHSRLLLTCSLQVTVASPDNSKTFGSSGLFDLPGLLVLGWARSGADTLVFRAPAPQ